MKPTEPKKRHLGRLLVYAGAVLAFFIGAGFATGQEILMYYLAWGREMFLVTAVIFVVLLWSSLSFATIGSEEGFTSNAQVYRYYCGRVFGTVYDLFSVVFCLACYLFMVAGAGSTLSQQFGLPVWVGASLMGILVVLTVTLGLGRITEVLGRLGTVILVFILFLSLWNLLSNLDAVGPNFRALAEGNYQAFGLQKSIAPNAVMNGLNYMGTVILWFITFVSLMAANSSHKREVKGGMVLGSVLILVSVLICCFAMIATLDEVGASDAPNLILASNVWAPLGAVFSIIVVLGIYTSAVPLLWTPVARFAPDGSRKARVLAAVLGLAGVVIALFVPYKTLVNYVINLGGMLSYGLYLFILIQNIRRLVRRLRTRRGA